jgi:ribonuclease J
VRQATGRVVVGHFASNVHRMATLAELAAANGRALCVAGRSMERHLATGLELGHLSLPAGQPISLALARERLAHRLLIAASGTQAEHRGALRRLAAGEHPELGLEPGDTVVLSSRTIPGNERAVSQMIDAFWRRGVSVVTPAERLALHASGHASAAELEELIGLVRPAVLLPVHGARHQLERLAALGRTLGVGEAVVRENGQPLLFAPSGPVTLGPAFDAVAVPFGAEQRLAADVLTERRRIGRGGALAISTAAGPNGTWRLEVKAVGLALDDEARRTVGAACLAALEQAPTATADAPGLERRLRRAATATLRSRGLGRPVIVVSQIGPSFSRGD